MKTPHTTGEATNVTATDVGGPTLDPIVETTDTARTPPTEQPPAQDRLAQPCSSKSVRFLSKKSEEVATSEGKDVSEAGNQSESTNAATTAAATGETSALSWSELDECNEFCDMSATSGTGSSTAMQHSDRYSEAAPSSRPTSGSTSTQDPLNRFMSARYMKEVLETGVYEEKRQSTPLLLATPTNRHRNLSS